MTRYNSVAIVGGSVAGLEVARLISDKFDVTLYEAHPEIGEPLQCAEGWFAHHQVMPPIEDAIVREIDTVIVQALDENFNVKSSSKIRFKDLLYMVDRKKLEKEMAKEAEEKGCKIVTGKRVRIPELASYDVIVDASGHPSQTDSDFGRRVRGAVAVEAVAKYEVDEMYIMLYPKTDGYIWIFPKEDGLSNIGLGYYMKPLRMRRTLIRFLEHIGAEPVYWTGGSIGVKPNFPLLREFMYSKIALVGDAAGLADMLGEGMTNAVISSRLLSECLVEGNLEDYERKVRKTLMPHIKFVDYAIYRASRIIPMRLYPKYFKLMAKLSDFAIRFIRLIRK